MCFYHIYLDEWEKSVSEREDFTKFDVTPSRNKTGLKSDR